MDSVKVYRTTRAPKSVLCYDMDKDPTLVWYSDFTCLVFPNKKTGRHKRVKIRERDHILRPSGIGDGGRACTKRAWGAGS